MNDKEAQQSESTRVGDRSRYVTFSSLYFYLFLGLPVCAFLFWQVVIPWVIQVWQHLFGEP